MLFDELLQSSGSLGGNIIMPKDIANLTAWYDAYSLLTTADGTPLTSLADLSGNGNTLTTTKKPILKQNIQNGKPSILFSSASFSTLQHTFFNFMTYTLITVSTSTAATEQCIAYNGNDATTGWGYCNHSGATRAVLFGGAVFKDDAAKTTNCEICVTTYNNSTSTMRVNGVNQSLTAATNTGNVPTGSFSLGSGLSARYFDGYIQECIIYNTALPTYQIQLLERYLATKWGLVI
jgi:hypothetical protein